MKSELPFLSHVDECPTLCWWLLKGTFQHAVFCNAGVDVYCQTNGFTMGTTAAPPWAQLVLRTYEPPKPLVLAFQIPS